MKKSCETNSCFFPSQFFHNPFISRTRAITASWNHYFCNISSTVGRDLHMSVCTNPRTREWILWSCLHLRIWGLVAMESCLIPGCIVEKFRVDPPKTPLCQDGNSTHRFFLSCKPMVSRNQNYVFNTRLDLWVSHTFCFRSWRFALIS